ncbi:oxygen-insensitive NADPH nitroreductase [Bacillus sonorensis]|uniref:NAD(P)H-dependent nitro/flavin reductase NfrA n=2 Tax=Bacillus sonorensis TaxID=119858 RepID=M5P2C3_9BACI|nr:MULTISPECIES: oxygen-insensitive NADPH nitroreductase [Bacillus]TWK80812.1 FMN reductase (NADPH) [Bacillus paralicheniformis]ASB86917.1 NADPH-flavin oxidoreductase [Bacillus sonorensis]EME73593.1 NAD(P)H-dependent nitro/flavin reductase NfrA [Bacillus sonorensis L12]MCZ0072596.1 oxygen-insensitive NADPH nitroreductase [Bacillus sonorensis]MCZ0091217.1 oxygen-insensitive NADPH nitroreductase [Bacillus sonorensis]
MNQTIETILNHRSIRSFTDQLLTDEEIRLLVESAQCASTSSYIQAYSIIGVTDQGKKRELAALAGNQPYVEKNGHLFVFCADLYRHDKVARDRGEDVKAALEGTETFMVSVIDAALAAQNMAVAAESMGLGICYIGGIRNDLDKVAEILKTPEYVLPLFGFVVGHPANPSAKKPRLPLEHIYHENTYNLDEQDFHKHLSEYDETISSYYQNRTGGKRTDKWTEQITQHLKEPKRTYMNQFVKEKGFNKR